MDQRKFQVSQLPALTLVIGGASSGKSDFAEHLVIDDGRPRYYLATAQAFDDEMTAKIKAHKAMRAKYSWTTVEAPRALSEALKNLPSDAVALIDCATLWLTNLMMEERDISNEVCLLQQACAERSAPVVIVSNEVGQGIVPNNKLARRFGQAQGRFNRDLAAQADLVVKVTAGLPQVLKGSLA